MEGIKLKKVTDNLIKKEKAKKQQKAKKWEMESMKFRQMLRQARGEPPTKANLKEQKLLDKYEEQSMMKCPVCGRTFNEKAGQRHIEFCKNKAKVNQYKKPNAKTQKIKRRY